MHRIKLKDTDPLSPGSVPYSDDPGELVDRKLADQE